MSTLKERALAADELSRNRASHLSRIHTFEVFMKHFGKSQKISEAAVEMKQLQGVWYAVVDDLWFRIINTNALTYAAICDCGRREKYSHAVINLISLGRAICNAEIFKECSLCKASKHHTNLSSDSQQRSQHETDET